jgi:hypothetical protein
MENSKSRQVTKEDGSRECKTRESIMQDIVAYAFSSDPWVTPICVRDNGKEAGVLEGKESEPTRF